MSGKAKYPSQLSTFLSSASSLARNAPRNSVAYVSSLFPIATWLPKYNTNWFSGDLIAGLTVAIIVIPQALAYAKLAGVPVEFGLYTSFVGALIYCLFATSKDVTIGATAVLSVLTGQVAATYNSDKAIDPVVFAVSVAFVTGIIETAIGLLRLGILVDFIPTPVIVGFTTGAGLTIICGQVSGMLGITGVDTNEAAYRIVINTLGKLDKIKIDAAFGLSALAVLLIFRFGTAYLVKRGNSWAIWLGYSSNAIVMIVVTLISFWYNQGSSSLRIRVVGNVPKGLSYIKVPTIPDFGRVIQASVTVVVVGILEHIAVTKSFGRINGYTPDANQEIVALGLTNLIGSFFGGYPATGSFSRSAIKSRSGVRTPLAGVYTGTVVLLSIYFFTPLFYFIPNAGLSALIINAISDLIVRPSTLQQLYNIEILDLLSAVIAFVFTIFFSIEIGIFVSVSFSVLVLLVRLARPRYQVLLREESGNWIGNDDAFIDDTVDPKVQVSPPGIFVFRVEESLTYPNSAYLNDRIKEWVFKHAQYGGANVPPSQRLWSDNLQEEALAIQQEREKASSNAVDAYGKGGKDIWLAEDKPLPRLRAIVFDLSAVNWIDATGLQTLVDLKRDLERFGGGRVPFYFVHVRHRFGRVLTYFAELLPAPAEDLTPVSSATNESKSPQSEGPSARNSLQDDIERADAAGDYASDDFAKGFGARNPTRFYRTIDEAVEDALYHIRVQDEASTRVAHVADTPVTV
ncbi:sulfate transporter family-domain-containing protein [Entophlyctis helioformis]|nr:sulfate transporter family-domain-containing protein [Entophlyctis helioformis]